MKKLVFEVIAYVVSSENIDDTDLASYKLKLNRDNSIGIYNKFLGMFSTKAAAEERIKEYIQRDKGKYDYDNIYLGFVVTAHELNAPFSEVFDDICNFSARYSYDRLGNLLCESELNDSTLKSFRGRKTPVKLAVNEIAMFKLYGHDSNCAQPVIITDLPLSEAQWRRHMADGVAGDYTDDCYTVVKAGFGHFHPETVEVFPFLGSVPNELRESLCKSRDMYLKGDLL